MISLKSILNAIAFVFTIFMVLYGLTKGFDTLELIMNILYFSVMVIVTFLDLLEELQKNV